MSEEVLSGIKVLVAIAKADGKLHDNEKVAIENVLEGADLGGSLSVDNLLSEDVSLESEMGKISSDAIRKRTYEAACALVYVDGDADKTEREILNKLRDAWEVKKPESAAERVGKALKQDWLPSAIDPIADAAKRDAEIDQLILRACIRAAIFGAIPIPFVGEFLVSLVEIETLQGIGALYGHTKDKSFWKAFAANFVGATAARIAVVSLMKLVPGWGSVLGASGAYASTWAMARATRLYFEKGQSMDPESLRAAFKEHRKEGLEKAKAASKDIEAEEARIADKKKALTADLEAGKIDDAKYAEELAKIAS